MTFPSLKKHSGSVVTGVVAALWATGAVSHAAHGQDTWQPDQWLSAEDPGATSQPLDPFAARDEQETIEPLSSENQPHDMDQQQEPDDRITKAIQLTEELMRQQEILEENAAHTQSITIGPLSNGLIRVPAVTLEYRLPDASEVSANITEHTVAPDDVQQKMPRFRFTGTEDLELNLVVGSLSWPGSVPAIPDRTFDFQTAKEWMALPWSTHRFTPPQGKLVDGFWIREVPKKHGNKKRGRSSSAAPVKQGEQARPQSRPADLEVRVGGGFWDLFKPQYTTRTVNREVEQSF